MSHATEGSIQAYLDGEIEGAAAAALSDHLSGCAVCSAELHALQDAALRTHRALELLDIPVPMLRAQAALAAERRGRRTGLAGLSVRSLARAAMLLLVLAGAAAAAIPEVRRALETTFARVSALFTGAEEEPVATGPVAEPPAAEAPAELSPGVTFVPPVDGRVRVILHAPESPLEVVVRLIDGPRAQVETLTADGQVRRRSGPGRLELMGLSSGTVTIGVPRAVRNATVEVDGRILVYKDGEQLRTSGPEGAGRGSEMRFRIGQ